MIDESIKFQVPTIQFRKRTLLDVTSISSFLLVFLSLSLHVAYDVTPLIEIIWTILFVIIER